jgi:2-alkenal reductase
VLCVAAVAFFIIPTQFSSTTGTGAQPSPVTDTQATQVAIPVLTLPAAVTEPEVAAQLPPVQGGLDPDSEPLSALYGQLNPGVVNIQVFLGQGQGGGAGSGFIMDEQGHIVTNNHVVAGAELVTVVFYNGIEAEADIIGTDDDSDLAVIKVAELPSGTHPLPLGDSDQVVVGEWVIAIGNPFGLGSSMTLGIVSAVGRTIASGATPFSIPQAVQTDAAINPGNSGGPLLNLQGEVIGVNAQIATSGVGVNSGVGFAIPVNVVRRVAPVLIEVGSYQWPWLGIEGGSVTFLVAQANNLETQQGAYIQSVVPGGPAERAGLRGSSGVTTIEGVEVPVGGDIIIEADGRPVIDFNDLLIDIAFRAPGDEMNLTIIRDGQRQQITLTLEARPDFEF